MRRRHLLAMGCGAIVSLPMAATAQPRSKIARIGWLSEGTPATDAIMRAAFIQGLRDLGYAEGQTAVIEPRFAAGNSERLAEMAMELVGLKIDVLVASGDAAAHAAKAATRDIPVVMHVADPVGSGLVASLARPGGNLTGLSDFHGGMITKRLELLKEIAPAVSRVAVLLNPGVPSNVLQFNDLRAAGHALGLTLLAVEVRGPADFDGAFAKVSRERPGAMVVSGDKMLGTQRARIIDFAERARLPAIYSNRNWTANGGLVSYGANFADLYRRAAAYVGKILSGARAADLPIEQPTSFELIVNLKAARSIGLALPPALIARADEVIE